MNIYQLSEASNEIASSVIIFSSFLKLILNQELYNYIPDGYSFRRKVGFQLSLYKRMLFLLTGYLFKDIQNY